MKRKKLVIIGAGSAMFTQGLIADFIQAQNFGKWEISLVDIDLLALESITRLAHKMIEHTKADLLISSSLDRCEVLPCADVVITTIAVGGRRAWEQDVFIPRKYGIFQPVGDTSMPGGISRALRMIPVMLEIAHDVKALCPEAYFFNYSNPMSAICQAVRCEMDSPMIGLCHGVFHVEHYLARFAGVPPEKVSSLAVGLNHLTFIFDLRYEGLNLWDEIDRQLAVKKSNMDPHLKMADSFPEMGGKVPDSSEHLDNPFSWSLYERYGAFPAVLDRHVVEFFPERFPEGRYYEQQLGVDAFSFEKVIAYGDQIYQDMHDQALGKKAMDFQLLERTSGEHEQLVEILRSLYHDERKTFSVNMPNGGAVSNLPAHSVLELPAVATGNGFYPLHIPNFNEIAAATLTKRIAVVDMTVKAALTGSRKYFVEALLLDGSVTDESTAERLADELLLVHQEHLPQFANELRQV